jgi:glycine cleavage system aminomethyltransferase T
MDGESALLPRLRQLAECVGVRDGRELPLRYGAVAGELAACLRSVGLVDREDLCALRIEAEGTAIDRVTSHRFAAELRPGQALTAGEGSHWGRTGREEAILVSPAGRGPALLGQLREELAAASPRIEQSPLVALGLLGPATMGLLTDLGVYGALAARNGTGAIATTALADDAMVTWMLFDDARALALVDPAHAAATWDEISAAGRRFGLCYVGVEAAERAEIVRRRSGDLAHC